MAKVQGVKEKLHAPLYDAFFVKDEDKLGVTPVTKKKFTDFMTDPRVIRFFVDVQDKTRLETNLQASGVLPSLNTFEARALRVVVSDVVTEGQNKTPNAQEVLSALIYNSVTTLIVGEKVMIEMPTYWFPAGAGVPTVANHGEPDPMATFRFAEPVTIEPQQNFRVEMLFPRGVPGAGQQATKLAAAAGPLHIWVVLDGYLTRDVQ